jgi:ABC-type dipeptide/oligopeptide/nickel transport system permease subunit
MTESIKPSDDSVFPTAQTMEGGVAVPQGPAGAPVEGTLDPRGTPETIEQAGLHLKVRSQWSYARMRFFRHRLALIGLIGLVIIFGAGVFANFVAPYGYAEIDLNHILQGPSRAHYFGTDNIGRDEFTRVLWGIRTSMEVGVFVAFVSTLVGLVVGAVAGFFGGWMDNLLMRVTDLVLTLPLLAILLTATRLLGQGSQWRVSLILVFFFWTTTARVVRGVYLSLREKEYVEAAKASGAGDMRLMFRHILPNTLGPIVVNATLAVGTAILVEAALSFLGFGIKPPTPSLGVLISDAEATPTTFTGSLAWWLTVFPGLTIVLIVLCVNFVGDGLRDALDPQQRRVRA